ncbi:hypothetical protein [Flagellimonas zhangzhouensis]|uniref:Uncharacterized protein n=1 Tax=Flagellimonas zhangzhouensis TaxID=1073328 RepID=A0A1H2U4A2_9FLAO|nr:hypothetical protein [Allomuricauda zhangzhouensis]SDQ20564.1 hypothetical protein SAMN05216294_0861 [Allomuricauda zhangzhouensis]SDW50767.1 hypothetical protein SAMN04487892_1433 [Allomuricauda zhangzhouensis]
MNYKTLVMVLFVSVLAYQTSAQEKQVDVSFFKEKAKIDAHYEQSFIPLNEEDEIDFWNDQLQYESDLKQWDSNAYHVYLKEKSYAYSEYAKKCNQNCKHSEHYMQHAIFYIKYYEYYYPRESSAMISEVRVETSGLEVENF